MRNPPSSSAKASKTTPCCSKVGLKRGPWTPEEDALLSNYIAREGEGRWRTLPKRANLLRCGKSCRLRWMNYLRPSVKRGHIAPDEEDLILRLHRLLGNRWSLIAGRIPGRTDNEIKNYWNTHLSKKLICQGIDPRTHKPMNPNPNTHATEPAPKPNPNPNSSALKENSSSVTNLAEKDKSIGNTWILSGVDEKLENYDRPATENENLVVEEDDMESLTDDVFSSFLNSLINEDMFLQQQQQQNVDGSSEHLVSSMTNFGSHAFWEDASSSPARVENEDSFVRRQYKTRLKSANAADPLARTIRRSYYVNYNFFFKKKGREKKSKTGSQERLQL